MPKVSTPSVQHVNRSFIGLDVYHEPQTIQPSELTKANNVYINGGRIKARAGKRGQLTTAHILGSPIYEPTLFVLANGTSADLFACNHHIYRQNKSASAVTEILEGGLSLNIDTPNVRQTRFGAFDYLIDGASALRRINLDVANTSKIVTGIPAPVTIPTANLTSTVLDPCNSLTGWSMDTVAGPLGTPNLEPNSDFTSPAPSLIPQHYGPAYPGFTTLGSGSGLLTFVGPDTDFYNSGSGRLPASWDAANTYVLIDDPGEGFYTALQNNAALTSDTWRYARRFQVMAAYYQEATDSQSGVDILVTFYNGGNAVGAQQKTVRPLYVAGTADNEWGGLGTSGLYIQEVFTLPDTDVEIDQITIQWTGTASNLRGVGVFLSKMMVLPLGTETVTYGDGFGLTASAGGISVHYLGVICGGCYIEKTYGSDQNWSTFNRIGIKLSASTAKRLADAGLSLKLGFRTNAGVEIVYSNPMTIEKDGSAASVDISTVALTAIRAAFRHLYLVFTSDVTSDVVFDPFMTFGPIVDAGNLSVGVPYDYVVVLEQQITSTDVVDSNPGPASNSITPTNLQAMGLIHLDGSYTSNSDVTHLIFARQGGFQDASAGPLIFATVPVGADASGTYWTWNHTTRTLTDNTPDSQLLQATPVVYGREAPPLNASAIAAWQGRLWLSVGNVLYASWLTTSGSALYFSAVNVTGSLTTAVEGVVQPMGSSDDPIVAMIPIGVPIAAGNAYGGALLVFKSRSVWLVQGDTAANFTFKQYPYPEGVGLVAKRGAARISDNEVAFLGPDKVHIFPPSSETEFALKISTLLYPQVTQIDSAAFSKAWLATFDRRIYIGAPQAGDSANTVAYVFDLRNGGWTIFRQMNVSGALVMPPGSVANDPFQFVLAGLDGQVYSLDYGTFADKASSDGAAFNIDWEVQSRAMGWEAGGVFVNNRALNSWIACEANETITTKVIPDDSTAKTFTKAFAFDGRYSPRTYLPARVEGDLLYINISGSTDTDITVEAMGLETLETRQDQ